MVCGQCYDSNGSFDEKEIFKFMLAYYSDIRQDSVQVRFGDGFLSIVLNTEPHLEVKSVQPSNFNFSMKF